MNKKIFLGGVLLIGIATVTYLLSFQIQQDNQSKEIFEDYLHATSIVLEQNNNRANINDYIEVVREAFCEDVSILLFKDTKKTYQYVCSKN